MKFLITLSGFLAGVAAVFALLINNPMQSPALPVSPDNAYSWQALEFHGGGFDASRLMHIPLGQSKEAFVAEGIDTANAAVLILRDGNNQPAALAIRLEALHKKNDLLRSQVGVSTYTNIIWPNYGSVFTHGYENRWPIIRDQALSLVGGDEYQPASEFAVSVVDGERTVTGGSGAFTAIGGRFTEELYVDPEQADRYAGRLELELQTGE
jgi:hypothetical protein